MGKYNVHAGHCPQGQGAYGAVGLLQESVENRKVKNRLIQNMKNDGHTVYDCTDDTNCSESQNLQRIVAKCNAHSVNLDISLHLNAGGGTGVEVWIYSDKVKPQAERICAEVSKALGIANRGVKYSQSLYVLKHTDSPALLVECCFVDNQTDHDHWNANKCADAIYKGITGATASGSVPTKPAEKPNTKPETSNKTALVKQAQTHINNVAHANGGKIVVDGIKGVNTVKGLVMVFQIAYNLDTGSNLAVDGIIGSNTRAAIAATEIKKGFVGYRASWLEIALLAHGYDPKGVEWPGEVGSGCYAALVQFQKDKGYYGGSVAIAGKTTITDLLK